MHVVRNKYTSIFPVDKEWGRADLFEFATATQRKRSPTDQGRDTANTRASPQKRARNDNTQDWTHQTAT